MNRFAISRNRIPRKWCSRAGLLLGALVLSGCAQTGAPRSEFSEPAPERPAGEALIAVDFINVMVQLKPLHPANINMRMAVPTTAFGESLEDALGQAGYAIETSELAGGPNWLDYSSSADDVADRDPVTYQVNIGKFKFKRSYRTDAGRVQPDSSMFVKGADASRLTLRDATIFGEAETIAKTTPQPDAGKTSPSQDTTVAENAAIDPPSEMTGIDIAKAPEAEAVESVTVAAMDLDIRTDKGFDPVAYHQGEQINLTITPSIDAHIYCYYQGGQSEVVLLFPNRFHPTNFVEGGRTIDLPGDGGWQIVATESGSYDEFMCIGTTEALSHKVPDYLVKNDLQPLPVENLETVFQQYQAADTHSLVKRLVAVEVM